MIWPQFLSSLILQHLLHSTNIDACHDLCHSFFIRGNCRLGSSGGEHSDQVSKVTSHGGQDEDSNTRSLTLPSTWAPRRPHSLELLLRLAPQVAHQPLGGEGVLRRHAPAHHGVEEGFPLTGVEPQHLMDGEDGVGHERRGSHPQ